jgi:hypothetical protein
MEDVRPKRVSQNFRLTPEAVTDIEYLAKRLGISKTAVVEIAVREMFEDRVGPSRRQAPDPSEQ